MASSLISYGASNPYKAFDLYGGEKALAGGAKNKDYLERIKALSQAGDPSAGALQRERDDWYKGERDTWMQKFQGSASPAGGTPGVAPGLQPPAAGPAMSPAGRGFAGVQPPTAGAAPGMPAPAAAGPAMGAAAPPAGARPGFAGVRQTAAAGGRRGLGTSMGAAGRR